MKLGARTFKTGLAVLLAIYIAQLIGLSPVVYAAVAASLTIMPTLYRSWQHMKEQIKANFIGAAMALFILALTDNHEPWVIGVVVVLAIAINIKLGFEKSLMVVVLTVIAILEAPTGNSIEFAFQRFLLILIGILSSVFVNMVFLPPKYETKLFESIQKTNNSISLFFKLLLIGNPEEKVYKEEFENVQKHIKKTKDLYELYREEYNSKLRKTKYSDARKLVVFRKFTNTLNKLYLLMETVDTHYSHRVKALPPVISEGIQRHLVLVLNYSERIVLKFDKKIKSAKKHERNEELYESSSNLMTVVIDHYKAEDQEQWQHGFPLVSTLVEITNELDYLEQLVENLNSHHICEEKIKKEKK